MNISELVRQCSGFEWDEGNLKKNWNKHSVSAEEIEEVFSSYPILFSRDDKHSQHEQRYVALGRTLGLRELFVSFTVRNLRIRVISARSQSEKERKSYAKAKTNSGV